MIFRQFVHEPLGACSYLVGCEAAGEGFVVDPAGDLGPAFYRRRASELGLTIAGVLETHLHSDFLSCARTLAALADVPHHLHEDARGRVAFGFEPLADGQRLDVGEVAVEVLHVPGHTPEHCCYLVTDRARGHEPWLLLSGDALLVDGVGTPDLLVGAQAGEGPDELERGVLARRSVDERLLTLAPHVEIFPAHCGGKPSSTISFEARFNSALRRRAPFERREPFPDAQRLIKAANVGLVGGGTS